MIKSNLNLIVGIGGEINIDYIRKLIFLGVKEFFIGFVPNYWIKKYGFDISPNRRYSKEFQIKTFKDFIFLSKLAKKYGVKIYFTLNDHNYSNDGFELIKNIISDTINYVDGYIVANYAVLEYLKDKGKEIHISGDICVFNNYSIDFFIENNVNRIILRRNITLNEIENICKYRNSKYKKLELELFINDSLLYTCGLCTAFHGEEKYIFCRDKNANSRILVEYNNKNKETKIDIDVDSEIIEKNCSLCFIPKFLELGIDSFKIPGRTGELDNVIKKIIYLKKFLELKKDFNGEIFLEEYDNCKLNKCMYEL